jgi:chlorophyll(ide) b reductase
VAASTTQLVTAARLCGTLLQSLVDAKPEQVVEVVTTNLLGSLLATRAAIQVMGEQPTAGHIFNVDGAGADGAPTPQYAAYGATKAGACSRFRSLGSAL